MDIKTVYTSLPEYEEVRNRLYCRLFNPGIQTRYSESILSRPWMDLALCCYFDMTLSGEFGTVPVRQHFLTAWTVTEEQVFTDACHDTEKQERVMFRSIDGFLRDLADVETSGKENDFPGKCPMYILSSSERLFGAVYMAFPAVLRQIARSLGESFYLIPSSVLECLILPESRQEDTAKLNHLVSTVNAGVVEENEVLADHIYYYDGEEDSVRMY